MPITLTDEQAAFVTDYMGKFGHASPHEVIDEAFRHFTVYEEETAQLRARLQRSEERIARGEYKDFANATELLAYVEEEKQRRRLSLQASPK